MACSSFLLFESLGHVPLRGLSLSNILVVDLRVAAHHLVVLVGVVVGHSDLLHARLLLLFLVGIAQSTVVDNVGALFSHSC